MLTKLPDLDLTPRTLGDNSPQAEPFGLLNFGGAETKPDTVPHAPPSKPAPGFVPLPAPSPEQVPDRCPERREDDDGKWPACR